jgi:hypothetical protein
LSLSPERLARLHPELYPGKAPLRHLMGRAFSVASYVTPSDVRAEIENLLKHGDARAATVVSIAPLCVAAYSDEFDAVVLLRFPERLTVDYRLAVGTRLITVNNYMRTMFPHQDITPGPAATGQFTGFYPLIADFLTDDSRLQTLKQEISEGEWRRAYELGTQKWQAGLRASRDGRPRFALYPAGSMREAVIFLGITVVAVAGIIAGWLFFFG